jgi:DNA-binding SARP family transcriptional activator/DNA replicative helicase MCM subunit Mcm2 (Cdc46/Mcm family)
MTRARFDLLGAFSWSVDGTPLPRPSTKKARALVAYLALNRTADVARERLVELFWSNSDASSGRENLRATLWSIRRSLRSAGVDPDTCLRTDRSTARWLLETQIDVEEFEALAVRREQLAEERARALYRGDFLEGDYDDWPSAQRAALANIFEELLARSVRDGGDAAATRRLLERNPYDEDAHARLIESDLRVDRAAAAVRLQRYRETLRAIGDAPSREFDERFADLEREMPARGEFELVFAGRFDELAAIAAARDAALGKRGTLVVLHGDAGIGKSTLIERAAHAARERGMTTVSIRAHAGDARPFGPWQAVFARLGGQDIATFARGSATAAVESIAHAIVAKLPDTAMLVVEDIHDFAGDSFEIAVRVAREASRSHLVVFTTRPEGERRVRAALGDVAILDLALEPLTQPELATAISAAAGVRQGELIDALWARTRGHPFFAASLLAALAERGTLVRDGRTWRWRAAPGAALDLPADLRRSIEERLRSAGPNALALASALAIDPMATSDDLVAALDLDQSSVLDGLDDLLTHGIIRESHGAAPFAFIHDLMREVAFGTANAGRRVALHRAFFARLRDRTENELDVSLRCARHLRGAGAPLNSGEYYLRAAIEALGCNASNDARTYIAEAIGAIERLERSPARDVALARLEALNARIAVWEGAADAARRHAIDAAALARAARSDAELARALLVNALVSGLTLQPSEQRAHAAEAADLAERTGEPGLAAAALAQLAGALRFLGEHEAALDAASHACTIARGCHDWTCLRNALEEQLLTQITWWQFDAAIETAAHALDPSLQIDAVSEAGLLVTRAYFWHAVARDPRAEADLRNARAVMREAVSRRRLTVEPNGSLAAVNFAAACLHAHLSLAQGGFDDALFEVAQLRASPLSSLERRGRIVTLLHIDALLARRSADDTAALLGLETALGSDFAEPQSLLGWSSSAALAHARIAVRIRPGEAGPLLRIALNAVEAAARRTPLLADVAFAQLALAAAESGDEPVRVRATMRADALRRARIGAFTVGSRGVD